MQPTSPGEFAALHRATRRTYEEHAAAWVRQRPDVGLETRWLDCLTAGLRPGSRILDLGCGAGGPVADRILSEGHEYVGVDFAAPLVRIGRRRHPGARWLVADMRALPTVGPFDAIISWDGFFHLSQADQRFLLPELSGLLSKDGRMLLTIGDRAGEVVGSVNGAPVYHASLDPSEYERRLSSLGFETVETVVSDPRADGRSILYATRSGSNLVNGGGI